LILASDRRRRRRHSMISGVPLIGDEAAAMIGDGQDVRIAVVRQEQGVVAQRRHGEANLLEVEEVLHDGHLAEEDAVRDRVAREECRRQVVGVAGLARVRPKHKRVEAARLAPGVLEGRGRRRRGQSDRARCKGKTKRWTTYQGAHVRVHVVEPVRVGRARRKVPLARLRELAEGPALRLALVVDTATRG
jgi:hypothetical protein